MTAKTVAIYARVSTTDQDCGRQIRDLQDYAVKLGFTVYGVYQEKASGARNDRKVRAEVMKLALSRKVDAVLVTELSRWGRNTVDLLSTLETLSTRDVSVIAQNGQSFDLSTATGKLFLTVLSAVSEFERDLIRERIMSGLQAAKARGKVLGRQTGDTFRQDEYQERILKLRAQGKSYRAIADELKIHKDTVMRVVKRNEAA